MKTKITIATLLFGFTVNAMKVFTPFVF